MPIKNSYWLKLTFKICMHMNSLYKQFLIKDQEREIVSPYQNKFGFLKLDHVTAVEVQYWMFPFHYFNGEFAGEKRSNTKRKWSAKKTEAKNFQAQIMNCATICYTQ